MLTGSSPLSQGKNILTLKELGSEFLILLYEHSFDVCIMKVVILEIFNGILDMPLHHVTRWSGEVFKYIAEEDSLTIKRTSKSYS